ncbi:MAG: hypothetical protein E7129_02425 [Rikenellaceae bacterium]|nr:hypothetical protein [Rikenellaceae bacterium]
MKKIFTKLMLLAVAATALASCAIDDTNDVATLPGVEVSINATTTDVSRSAFGELNGTTYPTLWEGNEEWAITVNERYGKLNNSDITFSEDGKTANAKRTFDGDGIAAADTYTLYLVSPYDACSKPGATSTLTINAAQTPSTTSCDPKAQVLVATATAEGNPYFETTFHHATAYGKFSFVNLNLGDATVNNITIESEVAFVNKFTYAFDGGTLTDAGASKLLTLATDATENLWFACAPVDVSGKKLTFTINTSNGPLSKVVTMPANSVFKSGVVAQFGVDMKDAQFAEQVKWELVTDAGALAVGSQIIIAAPEANYALSTNQASNNRTATAITKDGNYLADPSSDVQIITLEEGTVAGTFAFNVGTKGYLYASSSSSNRLHSSTTKNDNCSWKITIADNGEATVLAQGTSSRNFMRYNANNGSPIFNCYASNTTTGTLVAIYTLPSTDPAISASNIEVSAEGGDGVATYSVKNMTDDVTGKSNTDWLTAVVGGGEILWEAEPNYTGAARSGEIVLTSAGAGVSKTITVSQAADVFEVSATEISLGADTDATATFTVTSTHAFTLTSPDYDKVALSVESGKGEVEVTVTILVPNSSNSEVSRGNIVVTRTADNATKNVAVKQKAASTGDEPAAKTYTFTITKDDFNSTSYAANNNEKTSIATATDGSTMEVKWTSYQVMNQSSTMQWQKSKGYIYNSTDLGTIDNVVVDSSAGTFTTYKGSSAQPTTNGTGGYFQIKVGGATGKVNTITVTFTK